MLVEGDLNQLMSSVVDESGALFVVGVLQQLLTEVIAERV